MKPKKRKDHGYIRDGADGTLCECEECEPPKRSKEIVINVCFGGFGVSKAVYDELGIPWDGYGYIDNEALGVDGDSYAFRCDQRLINAIKKIGLKGASGRMSKLKIVKIPDDIEFTIEEYDGIESVHEKHRSWE